MDELKQTDLALYDLSKDVAKENDLRTELPEVYASLKEELIGHLSNVNSEYPGVENSRARTSRALKPDEPTPTPKRPSRDQFFRSRDRNGDGSITLKEFIGNPKGRNVPALTKLFRKLDRNGDDRLRLDELESNIE